MYQPYMEYTTSGYDIASLPWKDPACYQERFGPSISIRAMASMAGRSMADTLAGVKPVRQVGFSLW